MPPPMHLVVVSSPSVLATSITFGLVMLVSFVVWLVMCACGGDKAKGKEIPTGEDKPAEPKEATKETPEPAAAPAPEPIPEPKSDKGKSAKKAPAPDTAKRADASLMMKDAQDLQLMSKMEGPRSDQSVKALGAMKGDMPSLMLTDKSAVAAPAKSGKAPPPPAKSQTVSASATGSSGSVSVNAKSVIGKGIGKG